MPNNSKFKRFLPLFCPLLICLLYVALCCLNINDPIWYDEAYSHYIVRGDFAEIWSLTATDVHPPVYYFALKVWSLIFGTDVVAMRFMSVFFGVVALIFAYLLIKRHFSTRTAAIATLLMAFSPYLIRYGQEMRMYTLVLAIVMAASYALSRALTATLPALTRTNNNSVKLAKVDNSSAKSTKATQKLTLPKSARRYWLFYAILVALGMWTQYLSVLAWLAQLIYILYRFDFFQKHGLKTLWRNLPLRRTLLGTYGLAILLFLPWLPWFISQTASVQGGFWIGDVSVQTIANYFTGITFFLNADETTNWLVVLFAILVTLIIILALRAYRVLKTHSAPRHLPFLLCMAFLPLLLLLILSLPPLSPVFVARYVTYSVAFLWLLFGVILAVNIDQAVAASHPHASLAHIPHPHASLARTHQPTAAPRPRAALATARRQHLIPIILFIIALAATAAVGIVNVTNRAPSSQSALDLQLVQQASVPGESILIGDDWNFYETVPYSTSDQPIYFYSGWFAHDWSALDPIKHYQYNVINSLDDFLAGQDRFWLFVTTDNGQFTADSLATDPDFADFQIVNTITADDHIAYEFARSE